MCRISVTGLQGLTKDVQGLEGHIQDLRDSLAGRYLLHLRSCMYKEHLLSSSTQRVNMPRKRKTCPLCQKGNLVKLSNHLSDVHRLDSTQRKPLLEQAKGNNYDETGPMKAVIDEIRALKVLISSGNNNPCYPTTIARWETL